MLEKINECDLWGFWKLFFISRILTFYCIGKLCVKQEMFCCDPVSIFFSVKRSVLLLLTLRMHRNINRGILYSVVRCIQTDSEIISKKIPLRTTRLAIWSRTFRIRKGLWIQTRNTSMFSVKFSLLCCRKRTLSSVSALNMGCPPNVVILCPIMISSMKSNLQPWDASRAWWMEFWFTSFCMFRLAEKHMNNVSSLDGFFVAEEQTEHNKVFNLLQDKGRIIKN